MRAEHRGEPADAEQFAEHQGVGDRGGEPGAHAIGVERGRHASMLRAESLDANRLATARSDGRGRGADRVESEAAGRARPCIPPSDVR